ncbi:hypothetical protein [Clostridium sp.]|uniref:hypothetical protein n=1 Tax=Clostridium sp. TaxID=1506 RepID=UPI003F666398
MNKLTRFSFFSSNLISVILGFSFISFTFALYGHIPEISFLFFIGLILIASAFTLILANFTFIIELLLRIFTFLINTFIIYIFNSLPIAGYTRLLLLLTFSWLLFSILLFALTHFPIFKFFNKCSFQ